MEQHLQQEELHLYLENQVDREHFNLGLLGKVLQNMDNK
jgi:hypothetical protein